MTKCCVLGCGEIGSHKFPKDDRIRKQWIKAIRRRKFQPTSSSRLCRKRFVENDYELISKYTGVEHQHKYLKKNAIPTVFAWNTKPMTE
ncbi:hypothetical protein ABMA28_003306 [Loxostege sticticalis]|uniref:THAP-type domain-containing protein n=1 Tax=Loxostege sticticalis TaxID=481309 RepID=A0ABD0SYA9_LOXSC